MTFVSAVSTGLRHYAMSGGRASRSEYWYFLLFSILISTIGGAIDDMALPPVAGDIGPLSIVIALALALPSIAVQIRRLHDIGKSWRWGLLTVIPIAGSIALLIMSAQRGTVGANRFGPDPLESSHDSAGGALEHAVT